MIPKRLELLKEAVPAASLVAILWQPGVCTMKDMLKEAEIARRRLGIQLQLLGASGPDDFDDAFSAMSRDGANAIMVFPSPMLYLEHARIVDLVTKSGLPAVYPWREAVDAGGLIAYGASISELLRRAAGYVAKILKGANPGDLPIERPVKFELVVNTKAAKALGLRIPQSILARADEVIE